MFSTSIRLVSRPLLRVSRPTPSFARCFSQTTRRQAAEEQDSFLTNYQHTPLFRQLADKPEALRALNDFAKMLQEQGIDISGATQPSTTQMIRLAASARFRGSAKKVMEELRNAGIDLSSKDAMDELMKMGWGGKK